MKIWLIGIVLFVLSTTPALSIEEDKIKHIGVSSVISSAVISFTDNAWLGFGSCMGVGLAKEGFDSTQDGNKFDMEDMMANGVGCALGIPIGKAGNRLFFDGQSIEIKWKF